MPVTTWIIIFLVGDPNLNLHLPLVSWEGGQPKVYQVHPLEPLQGAAGSLFEGQNSSPQKIHQKTEEENKNSEKINLHFFGFHEVPCSF